MWIESPNGEKRIFRTFSLGPIEAGETLITMGAGGGGWGDPLDRDMESVREDVQNELISPARARDVYGVVLDEETFMVDLQATEKWREQLRARKDQPPQA
jgi:N-methylhydantoinase B